MQGPDGGAFPRLPDCSVETADAPTSTSKAGVIVGAVVGTTLVVAAVALFVVWRLRRKRFKAVALASVSGTKAADLIASDLERGPPLAPASPSFKQLGVRTTLSCVLEANPDNLGLSYITTLGQGSVVGDEQWSPTQPSSRQACTVQQRAAACELGSPPF